MKFSQLNTNHTINYGINFITREDGSAYTVTNKNNRILVHKHLPISINSCIFLHHSFKTKPNYMHHTLRIILFCVLHYPFFCIVNSYNPGQKSLGQYRNMHIFLSFLGFLLKQCIIFEIFLYFSLPPPYTKLKLGNNSGYTRPTLFVGWREGLDLCELENAPETQKCPKTFVHDCRL